ncbi:response regulator [Flavonifractor plautii]|nr:response regulator [Flavonifractor plautii]
MLHIMVVDDEAPIRDWLVYCIQKCEAASSVTSAVNGEEAYRRILEQKPNVVFTDIRMPGMDGLELMSKVRDILPFTVFIILTNYAEFSYAKQAISLGAREYILKSEMRSSDIQRIVAEIAATTAKIRSEKVHDVLQDGVVDLYEMYRNFEQPGAVAAFWQRQGLRPGQPYLAFCVANDSSLDLRRQMVALASASRAPFSAAAMVQEHLYLLLQCPEAEALRGYALDTEAALGSAACPPACPPCAPTSASSSVCWGGGGGSRGLLLHRRRGGALLRHLRPAPIDREAAHARKQEVLRLLARRQVEEARGALRAWFALFGMVGADDVRWAVDTVNRMVISMEDWYYQFVTPPPTAGSRPSPLPPAAAAARPCWSRCSGNGAAATPGPLRPP